MRDRMLLQELSMESDILEFLEICMTSESFDLFIIQYRKNPFIIHSFKQVLPNLFLSKKGNTEEKPKTGIQAMMERNKKRYKDAIKSESSWLNFVVKFMDITQQPYDIVNKITYTYMNNILEERAKIKKSEDEKSGNKTDISKVSKSIYGGK